MPKFTTFALPVGWQVMDPSSGPLLSVQHNWADKGGGVESHFDWATGLPPTLNDLVHKVVSAPLVSF